MEERYHTNHPNDTRPVMIHKNDKQALRDFPVKNGQALLPMVELIEQSALAVVCPPFSVQS